MLSQFSARGVFQNLSRIKYLAVQYCFLVSGISILGKVAR